MSSVQSGMSLLVLTVNIVTALIGCITVAQHTQYMLNGNMVIVLIEYIIVMQCN